VSGYIIPNRFSLEIPEGDYHTRVFIAPVQIDLAGKKLKMQLRKNVDSPVVVLNLTTDNNLIQVSDQQFTLFFLGEQTVGKRGSYVSDIVVYTDETDELTIGRGDITIKPKVSRA
jgi:hypothetical protein